MPQIFNTISDMFIPFILISVLAYGIVKKVPLYDCFIRGAKEGLTAAIEILPFIIAIFLGIEAITSSGALKFFEKTLNPVFSAIGIPQELISIILLRPVSGSGSLVLMEQVMAEHGADSMVGTIASVMVGTCETVLYVLALYFGVTAVKKIRYSLTAGIISYVVSIFASVYICYAFYS